MLPEAGASLRLPRRSSPNRSELGLITVQNRGRLTNVVRIIAPKWLATLPGALTIN
jgi:hypothetical protein